MKEEIKFEEFKDKIRTALKIGRPLEMSNCDWRQYESWAKKKLKESNPYGFKKMEETQKLERKGE